MIYDNFFPLDRTVFVPNRIIGTSGPRSNNLRRLRRILVVKDLQGEDVHYIRIYRALVTSIDKLQETISALHEHFHYFTLLIHFGSDLYDESLLPVIHAGITQKSPTPSGFQINLKKPHSVMVPCAYIVSNIDDVKFDITVEHPFELEFFVQNILPALCISCNTQMSDTAYKTVYEWVMETAIMLTELGVSKHRLEQMMINKIYILLRGMGILQLQIVKLGALHHGTKPLAVPISPVISADDSNTNEAIENAMLSMNMQDSPVPSPDAADSPGIPDLVPIPFVPLDSWDI